jgi:hypothetical protein
MTRASVVRPVQDVEFSAEAHGSGRLFNLKMAGTADLNVKIQLDQFIGSVHDEALRISAEEVVVDLRQLEFMNSSCLKTLVWWIGVVQDMAAGTAYRITFLSSPSMYWQRRSLHALACLASGLVSIKV